MSFMRHLAAAVALTFALVALTGSALAAPPSTPPGQEQKAEHSQAPATPPGQEQKAEQAATSSATSGSGGGAAAAPGQAKQSSTATSTKSAGINASTSGTKPSTATNHEKPSWTTVGANPNVSKRYGNGDTAAGIADSRGAGDSEPLYGPGNSRPHKVCGPNGKWVDVHAVKTYPNPACTDSETQATKTTQQVVTLSCPTSVTTVAGVAHETGSGKVVVINPNANSAHLTKHGDDAVTAQVVLANGAVCDVSTSTSGGFTSETKTELAQVVQQALGTSVVSTTQVGAGNAAAAGGVAGVESASGKGSAGGAAGSAGGVAGAAGGVAGAFGVLGQVAGGTLPFTGLPLWAILLIALYLIALGIVLRRHARPARDIA